MCSRAAAADASLAHARPTASATRTQQVTQLRAERKTYVPDPRFTHVVDLVRSGFFGWEDYFGPIMDAITTGGDFYLVANDFPSYLEAQVCRVVFGCL
jgi:hypothetical protein